MRELSLLDTSYLSGLLLLSLVLPMMMSFSGPLGAAAKRSCMRIVWTGQLLGALAGVAILASATLAPYAAAFGLVNCLGFAFLLRRQFLLAGSA